MLETAKQYHKVPFDRVISVAEANSFKPHVATYTKAAELWAFRSTRFYSLRTTHSIASEPNQQACGLLSSTVVAARSA